MSNLYTKNQDDYYLADNTAFVAILDPNGATICHVDEDEADVLLSHLNLNAVDFLTNVRDLGHAAQLRLNAMGCGQPAQVFAGNSVKDKSGAPTAHLKRINP